MIPSPEVLRRAAMFLLLPLSACAPLLAVSGPQSSTGLAAEIDAIFDDPSFAHAHWGVLVRSLDSGETIYARNAARMFVPASNVKLLTGAVMLETLGPQYRYRSTIALGGPLRNGVVEGPLVVTGTGDPTLSSRFLADPRDVFRAWADSLRANGVTRVSGGIVAVDTAFTDAVLGAGWSWDDLSSGYAAEFGPLQFNESVIQLDIFPSRTVLDPAVVVLSPSTQYVRIVNDTRTMPAGSVTAIRVMRDDASAAIVVRGEIAEDSQGLTENVAVRDPALYTVSVLRETLREQGILVEGPAIRHTTLDPYGTVLGQSFTLFYHDSPAVGDILPGMLKPSQNLIAETILRTVGREMRGAGTAAGGVAVVDSLLQDWGLGDELFRMADGSGLSRYNLLSPNLIVGLLERMDRSVHRAEWIGALPAAGRDGTLENRMRDPPLLEQVIAKTGTLSGVRALSGYLTTTSGERIVFSTIVNHHLRSGAAVDQVVESALRTIATRR